MYVHKLLRVINWVEFNWPLRYCPPSLKKCNLSYSANVTQSLSEHHDRPDRGRDETGIILGVAKWALFNMVTADEFWKPQAANKLAS